MQVARARVSRTGKISGFTTSISRALETVQSTLGVGGCGREIFSPATCSLQFAKASAATLSQQEKNDTADVQRGIVKSSSGFIGSVVS
jgi:ribosomal protein S3